MTDAAAIPAGPVAAWVAEARAALASGSAVDVPCGSCTACCRSAYFIHVEPDEERARARIPRALLVPAPGLPKGHLVMGFDQQGRCPMLVDDACSIYDDRPRTCRRYDCRVFAVAGVDPADDGKPLVADRVRRWQLDVSRDEDRDALRAVRDAVVVLRARGTARTEGELAIEAVRVSGREVGPA